METSYANDNIAHQPQQQQWNLFQKPIRVEMISSALLEPMFNDENHEVVQHFIGVTAEIIKVLSAVMNFSGKMDSRIERISVLGWKFDFVSILRWKVGATFVKTFPDDYPIMSPIIP